MKKLILLLTLLFLISGCTIPKSEIAPFNNAIINYDQTKTYGYYYQSIQTTDSTVMNEDRITQKIDWVNDKAYTEVYEKRIGLFEDSNTFTESDITTYYSNNQIGQQILDGEVTWTTGTLEEYIKNEPPISSLFETYFEGFIITELESGKQLDGTIKDPSKVIKNGSDVVRMDITIRINTEGLLTYIYIEIVYPLSTVTITYEVFYEVQTVVIP